MRRWYWHSLIPSIHTTQTSTNSTVYRIFCLMLNMFWCTCTLQYSTTEPKMPYINLHRTIFRTIASKWKSDKLTTYPQAIAPHLEKLDAYILHQIVHIYINCVCACVFGLYSIQKQKTKRLPTPSKRP